ncbi:MAG: hypothetical protein EPN43_13280 [Jatrophihabitans sp.]|nr:MAG: hypothetical protein EPN43_13280 [Jatrophihabitans sp.]
MRTTINIDEHVLARAKAEAGSRGLTLGEYIQRRLAAPEPEPAGQDRDLPVYRGPFNAAIGEMSNAELLDLLDQDLPLDKRR